MTEHETLNSRSYQTLIQFKGEKMYHERCQVISCLLLGQVERTIKCKHCKIYAVRYTG